MSTGQLILSILGMSTAVVGAYAAWRKLKPTTRDITVTTADKVNVMTLRFAGDVGRDNEELRQDLAELRKEFDQYRSDTQGLLAELTTEVRAERAEKEFVKRENEHLKRRVTELETEVERLKSRSTRA